MGGEFFDFLGVQSVRAFCRLSLPADKGMGGKDAPSTRPACVRLRAQHAPLMCGPTNGRGCFFLPIFCAFPPFGSSALKLRHWLAISRGRVPPVPSRG